jgi:hypothetical protein
MKKWFFWLIFLTGLLYSCKNSFFYNNGYARKYQKLKRVDKNYNVIDRAVMVGLDLCILEQSSDFTSGKIIFNREQLISQTIESFKKKFTHFDFIEKNIDVSNGPCNSKLSGGFLDHLNFVSDSNFQNSVNLFSKLFIYGHSQRNREGAGGLELSIDLGNDRHALEYTLITGLMIGDSIIYVDTRTHWTNTFSERGEQLKYHVPQVVIDSLVTLTLQEYFKRME